MRLATRLALAVGLAAAVPAAAPRAADAPVVGYHGDQSRGGHYVLPGLTWAAAATMHRDRHFDGRVKGHVYAQPLYWQAPGAPHGMLIVATESNVVEAIDAQTGAEIWERQLGRVVPRSDLPCGDISPLGITGTPVLDAQAGAIYLDAFITTKANGARHRVFGLSLTDGSVLPGWPVDVAAGIARHGMSFTPTIQNQRGALTLIGHRLYVPFGGNDGDCEAYHGWVVGLSTVTPGVFGAWATRAEKGGIWGQGATVFDGKSLFAATGNTEGATQWGDGEAIVRLPLDLQHSAKTQDYYTPSNWQTLDDDDADLGGTGPLPINLPTGDGGSQALMLGLGKDGDAYLLDRDNLGGMGGALVIQQVADSVIITGPTTYRVAGGAMVAFHASGSSCPPPAPDPTLVAIVITPPATVGSAPGLRTAWCASFTGGGAPISTSSGPGDADPIVWMVGGDGDQMLHGFRGDTGQAVFAGGGPADAAPGVRHLSTLLAAEGRLYVAGDGRVFAYGFTPASP